MFAVSSKKTEQGSQVILAGMLAEEREKRSAAQRAAWEAEVALAQSRLKTRQEAAARAMSVVAELRAQGYRYRPNYRILEAKACRLFHVTPAELKSNRRHRKICFARQFIMYWAVRLTNLSLPQIGRLMGGKDHTTILHGKRVYPEKRAYMGRNLRPAR